MSRAYRIRISESLDRIEHLKDGVALKLEILDILPREEMSKRLAAALEARGFTKVDGEDDVLEIKPTEGVTIRVDVQSGQVEARVEGETRIQLKKSVEERGYDEARTAATGKARVQKALEAEAAEVADVARQALTKKLEAQLVEIRPEIDKALNEATASALKTRAAQLGEVESIEEDQDNGSLVIRVKV